jgi:PKD repeat protein
MKTTLSLYRQEPGAPVCKNPKQKSMKPKQLIATLLACCIYLFAPAQTTPPNCSADFSYSITDQKKVIFTAQDSLGALHYWWFGDGTTVYTEQQGRATHVYNSPGTYEVKHIIVRGDCKDTVAKQITLQDYCKAQYEWYRTNTTSPYTIQFKNKSTSFTDIKEYLWKFGDGTSSTEQHPLHSFSGPGTYEVCLKILTRSGCESKICTLITLADSSCNITPKFEVIRDAATPLTLKFVNQSIVPASDAQYKWSFGDGTTATDKDPVHTYAAAGTYNVCLTVYVNNSCIKEKCNTVIVEGNTCAITAKFEWRKDSANCKNILFRNLSTVISPNVQFIWKFGDGSSSTATNPNHIYTQPGKYYVCLVAEAGPNCRKEYCDSVIVRCDTVPQPPTCDVRAKYTWKKDAQQWNLVYFANTSEPVSRIWKTRWWYGDGTESADFNSFHKYEKPGVYLVCLGVTSLNGCISYYCDSVRVIAPDTCSSKSNFTVNRTPNSALILKFEASYRSSTARYYWSFGDGTAGTGAVATHYYQKTGKYKVCLTVKEGNCSTTTCKEIQAGANCDSVYVKYEYKRSTTRPNQITFNGITNDLPFNTQVWTIYKITPNGVVPPPIAILNQLNPTYLFTDTGSYKVCLKAITGSKCVKEYCQTIKIEKLGPNLPGIITAFPNPAVNSIVLELTLTKAELVSFVITDAAGSVKAQYTKNGAVGNNRFTLPVEQLSQGYYMVEIKTATSRWTSKFQKG